MLKQISFPFYRFINPLLSFNFTFTHLSAALASGFVLGCVAFSGVTFAPAKARLVTRFSLPLTLDIASTPEQQRRGLMGVSRLAPDRGMLFDFPHSGNHSMWMRGMKIPLDIVFFSNSQIVAIEQNLQPCISSFCPTYTHFSDKVIELPAHRAGELAFHIGDRIDFSGYRSVNKR